MIAAAVAMSPDEEIALYDSEAEVARGSDPRRNARLLYEVGRLRERQGNMREAGRCTPSR